MDTFLVAINGSKSSDTAALLARELLQVYPRSQLIALYVTEMVPDRSGYSPRLGRDNEDKLACNIFAKLRSVFLHNLTSRVHFRHIQGTNRGKVICQTAMEYDCDLIVVGCDRKGFIQRVISGSVTYDVLKRAKMPVLVARDKFGQRAPSGRLVSLHRAKSHVTSRE
ncbi:universal stress protein [Alicyclobacillus mengziensis]|uniref:Universal stress protein n=1 Tax=Alicyclobacillus mengziensis TaxID=2931921 RepID=A0A9X7VY82_9BACL|nr:universal stress protein [Alicyclobacillus mengziensis]QSO46904.1 universal stress protein [Alicyclobacillus mengziensis]